MCYDKHLLIENKISHLVFEKFLAEFFSNEGNFIESHCIFTRQAIVLMN